MADHETAQTQRVAPTSVHPLELGEVALRALFGFVIEGYPHPDDIDAENVVLRGFRVTDPTGREQAERDAAYQQAQQSMGPPRMFRMGPDGLRGLTWRPGTAGGTPVGRSRHLRHLNDG